MNKKNLSQEEWDEELEGMAAIDANNPKHVLFAWVMTLALALVVGAIIFGVYALFNWIIGLW